VNGTKGGVEHNWRENAKVFAGILDEQKTNTLSKYVDFVLDVAGSQLGSWWNDLAKLREAVPS
jgi:hypothetical protein